MYIYICQYLRYEPTIINIDPGSYRLLQYVVGNIEALV